MASTSTHTGRPGERRVPRSVARRIAAWIGLALAATTPAAPGALALPVGILVVRVLDAATREPIPNAQVTDLDASVQRLSNASGEVRLDRGDRQTLRLRVRQLGYRFVERTLALRGASVDTTLVLLQRVPFALPEQRTIAVNRCEMDVDPAAQELSLLALSQLRLAAEQYDEFRRTFPFDLQSERRTVVFRGRAKVPDKPIVREEQTTSERWGEQYEPGQVLRRERVGFSASILFVRALADSAFWDRHCLVARAVEAHAEQRWLRLEFAPSRDVDTPDWAGSAWLDSATSALRRVEFRLTGLRDRDSPRRLEGYTTFRERSPFITVPDSTIAYWWRRGPDDDGEWGLPDVLQLIHVTSIQYRGAAPPPP